MEEELRRNMAVATKNLQKCEPSNKGGSKFESEYGIAFYELIKAGFALPLRKKMRIK